VTLRYDEADRLAGRELAVARHHIPRGVRSGSQGLRQSGFPTLRKLTKCLLPVACQMVSAVLEDRSRLSDRPL